MAQPVRANKAEAVWREAAVATPYEGKVGCAEDSQTGREWMVIQCADVVAEYGADAEVLDDGRSVSLKLGDYVAFGVVRRPKGPPLAVNVWGLPPGARKKRRQGPEEGADALQDSAPSASKRNKAAAEAPSALVGELLGVVRNQSSSTGDYFLECAKVSDLYGRDAKIRVHEMPRGIRLGDAVIFEVAPPASATSAPVAGKVRKASGPEAEAARKEFAARKGGKSSSKGSWNGWGGQAWKPATTLRMLGMVKRPHPSSGRHFVFCQDISDVYGRDAQIPKEAVPETGIKLGDRISFDIEEPPEGFQGTILAWNVRVVGGRTKAAPRAGDGEDDEGDAPEPEELDEPDDDEAGEVEGGGGAAGVGPGEDGDEDETLVDGGGLEELASRDASGAELYGGDGQDEDDLAQAALPVSARPQAGKSPAPPSGRQPAAAAALPPDPDTPEGWRTMQDVLFPGLPKLKTGWIRIRSKSRGLVYYYNTVTGESTPNEPLA